MNWKCVRARGPDRRRPRATRRGPVSAQITTGTVAGSVKDDQGLAVPGATVTLISEARGTRMAPVVTNATGDFVVPNVTPDTYTVEVIDGRVHHLRRPGVAVSGGDRVGVGDLTLSVGKTTETVTVSAEVADDSVAERRALVPHHDRRSGEPPDRHRPQFRDPDLADARRHGHDDPPRRRRSEQHHDGRRVHDGHRQQRAVAADESRGDCRGEGPDRGLSGRVRAVERPADHGGHQERNQPLPRIGLRRHAELRLELQQLGEQDQRHAQGGRQAVGLGLHVRRAGRQARRRQQAVLLLRPRVPAAKRRECAAPVPRPDAGRTRTATSPRRSTTTARRFPR